MTIYRHKHMLLVALTSLAVLAGALIRGYTGFGASMVWVASLSLVYPPATVVPTVLMLEVLASITLLPTVFGAVQWRSMRWLLASTVLTMPVGVALLTTIPEREMRIVVAAAILAATVAVARGVELSGPPGLRSTLVAGSISGVVNGSTGMGGPPAVLLYFSGANPVDAGRATLIAYFLGTDAIGVSIMAASGLVDRVVLIHTALFAPLALIGIAAGQRVYKLRGERGFRRVVLGLLLVLAAAMLLRALAFG